MKTTMLFLASLLAFIVPASTDTASTAGSLPDLCDDVYLDEDGVPIHDSTGMTLARHCEWTGPDAPWWGTSVCCSFDAAGAHCTAAGRDGCAAGTSEMWCDYGEQDSADESVTCYQPLPDACDLGYCDDAPAGTEQGDTIGVCCLAGHGCWEIHPLEGCPMGMFMWCGSPYTKEDGTVGCESMG